ncbi:sugar porter family MFS transporter [Citrobacter braakii]|uniref:sugar porter family MFS transporter n=1 Tax=Citrobacter braakii TaxID=57706 RepID=UPI0024300802|nr:sugar porter family MFS transporter [Citrobacter braakii]WFV17380.1 sugar porter family MFS transporter [Citrobacter braakii]
MTLDSALPTAAKKHKTRPQVIWICLLAALAGLLFGLDIGVISGALPLIAKEYQLLDSQQEWVVSSMMVGAAVATLCSGFLAYRLGRKYALLIAAASFCLGAIICTCAVGPGMLIVGRLILGVGLGVASYATPLYLSEITPKNIRGAMISAYQLMIALGILLVFLTNTAFSYSGNWRGMLLVVAIPSLVFLFGALFLPRSPRWLMMHGREEEARIVLIRLRNSREEVENELSEIKEQLNVKQQGWNLFKENRNFRRSVSLGIILQIMQQFSGVNVMMYYAPRIFHEIGFTSTAEQMWGTVIVGFVMTLATFIAVGFVDRWGRKPMLYAGFITMGFAMSIVGTLLGGDALSALEKGITVTMLLLFIVGFSMSAGPLIWLLCSEIQPLKGREFGITCSTFTCHIAGMIVSATFLSLLNSLGSAHTFYLYALLNIVALVIIYLFVPETKNISLERIEQNLMAGKKLRNIGQ